MIQNLKPTLRDALKQRGVELAPLLSPEEWSKMISNMPGDIVIGAKEIYSDFNGFDQYDYKSQMRLWTLKEIIDKNNEIKTSYSSSYFLIGDVMIESNYILYDNISLSIVVDGYDDGIFKNISEILEYLVKGNFDLF